MASVTPRLVQNILVFLCLWACQVASHSLRGASMFAQHKPLMALNGRGYYDASMLARHEQWMALHGRVYSGAMEKKVRFKIFKENVERIESLNSAGNLTYKLSINKFADQTNNEFKSTYNGFKRFSSTEKRLEVSSFKYENDLELPYSMDWRTEGAVTSVKSQGQCGCCWAFSAVAAIEGITQIKTGKLVPLSEQELVDCDKEGQYQGCKGGNMEDAFEFVQSNNGLATETLYPYQGVDSACKTEIADPDAAKITGYEYVPENNEQELLKAVARQPVSVAIDAAGDGFRFYSSGVFTGDSGTHLDHGVTIVGYGVSDDGVKYWLIKNSWGSGWGENGYMRMQRDVSAKEGLRGIAMHASYPTA